MGRYTAGKLPVELRELPVELKELTVGVGELTVGMQELTVGVRELRVGVQELTIELKELTVGMRELTVELKELRVGSGELTMLIISRLDKGKFCRLVENKARIANLSYRIEKMKLTTILFLFTINCFSQTEKVVSLAEENVLDTPNGIYLKDIDNRFSPYLGNWKYEDSIYKYEITTFSKRHVLIKQLNEDYYYEDQILTTYKVTDIKSNSIIFDSQQNRTFEKEFNAFGYKKMQKVLLLNFYDSNGGNISVELHWQKRHSNILTFNIASKQVVICGEPNFDSTKCPLPKNISEFKKWD